MPYGKILIIDEDAAIRRLVSNYFEKQGMECFTLSRIDDLAITASGMATVIILSKAVAGEKLESSITALRRKSRTPLIVTAAFTDHSNIERYLDYGADDVIKKPLDIAELAQKTQTLIRRWEADNLPPKDNSTSRCCKGLYVDLVSYRVTADGTEAVLSPKEIELLFLMMSRPGYVFGKGELSSNVWGRVLADNRTIPVHIARIKKKIGRYAECITAVRGIGYVFNEPL